MATPRMSKAHFEFIAEMLRKYGETITLAQWKREFQKTNPQFKGEVFLRAATPSYDEKKACPDCELRVPDDFPENEICPRCGWNPNTLRDWNDL